ncbi:MAG: hypothetical protein IPM17_17750 [Verrucomicrobia bacterium]|nr:hypothetical protein [Verrucomicrobiota bacterium]
MTKVNGSTTLDQNRSHDKANEILTLTGTPDWVDPTHDAAGNTTKVPQPATPASSYDCKFDAWDRLVEVKVTGGAVVSTLRYDGLKRRLTKVAGGNTRHYYYSSRWQVLEERLNALTTADRQFVWGIRHVDDLVERDRSSERFYVLHDHLSVTAIINTTGAVQERYGYDGFGPQRVMDASFGARASSLYDWETGFAAYRLDTESGLYQVRHRCYHPKLGRWITRDPVVEVDVNSPELNYSPYSFGIPIAETGPAGVVPSETKQGQMYVFVSNSPLTTIDPSGLWELRCRPLTGIGRVTFQKHCWIECGGHSYSLLNNNGIATKVIDDPRDKGKGKAVCQGSGRCDCIAGQFSVNKDSYPYDKDQCNSNYFANSLLKCCGINNPKPSGAYGWDDCDDSSRSVSCACFPGT